MVNAADVFENNILMTVKTPATDGKQSCGIMVNATDVFEINVCRLAGIPVANVR